MSTDNISEAFRLEILRDRLAFKNRLQEFKETYSIRLPEIPDKNSNSLWDKLNSNPFPSPKSDPMGYDRSTTISNWIKKNTIKSALILNVGFGSGSLEDKFRYPRNKLDWHGVDISEKSVKSANHKYPFGKFRIGSIHKLPYKSEMFDLVIVSEVLEHIRPSKVFKSLEEVHRVLKTGGFLIVSVPVNENLHELVKRGLNTNAHVRSYTQSILLFELKLSGFNLIEMEKLYAFSKYYYLKKFLIKFFPFLKKPNNLLLLLYKL